MSKKKNSLPPVPPDQHVENEPTTVFKDPKRNQWLAIGTGVGLLGIIAMMGLHSSNVKDELAEIATAKKKLETALEKSKKEERQTREEYSEKIAALKEKTEALEERFAGMATSLESAKSRLGDLKSTVGDLRDEKRKAERELGQFKRVSKKFERMISSGKLEVNFRRGRMVVNLPAQVLFDSGSAELTEDGLKALREVAKVLRKVKNKRFVVGGHTDNRKIKKADFGSNWELASARAIGVTKALIKSGLAPNNLIAAGYAQYSPIASNGTEAGRQKNRRIEIILEPYLKELNLPSKKSKATAKKAAVKKNRSTASKAAKKKSKSLARRSKKTNKSNS